MKDPLKMQDLESAKARGIILACILFGLLWAVLPMFGWSYYALEGALTSCSVIWNDKSFNVVSYNITIFIFVYFLPLVVIFKVNFALIRSVIN